MICPKCGKQIEVGSDTCKNCGRNINYNFELGQKNGVDCQEIVKPIELNKKNIKIICLVVVVMFVLTMISSLAQHIKDSKIELDNYINETIEFSGGDGYGSVNEDSLDHFINYDSLASKICENRYTNNGDDIAKYFTVISPQNDGKLSNGDKVEIIIEVDQKGLKEDKNINKNIVGGDKIAFKYEVSGLPECIAIDIFDAIESFNYDLTLWNGSTEVVYKENYIRKYKNGIEVRVEDGEFIVYGNEFYSFKMGVETHTDNIHSDTETIELFVECDENDYLDYGLMFVPASKFIDVNIISYITDDTFNKEDVSVLTDKVKDVAVTNLTPEAKLECAQFYVYKEDSSVSTMLVYYFKNGEIYNVIVYDDLKQNKNSVFDVENQQPDVKSGWSGAYEYSSIEDFENEIIFSNKYNISIN